MKTARLVLASVLLTLLVSIAHGSTASAGDAQGCQGSATSTGPNGGLLDSVTAPGAGGTKNEPFDIFADSTVQYQGTTDQLMRNGSWSVEVGGVLGVVADIAEFITNKSLLSGRIGDGAGVQSRSGAFQAKEYSGKLGLSGLQKVTVRLSGEGGASCIATVWIRFHQSFFKSILAVGGMLALLLAVILFYMGAPVWAIENTLFETFEGELSPPGREG